jgi:hypothetical protein
MNDCPLHSKACMCSDRDEEPSWYVWTIVTIVFVGGLVIMAMPFFWASRFEPCRDSSVEQRP